MFPGEQNLSQWRATALEYSKPVVTEGEKGQRLLSLQQNSDFLLKCEAWICQFLRMGFI